MNLTLYLAPNGELVIDLDALHQPVLTHVLNLERRILTALEDVHARVDALDGALKAANAKTDLLIAGNVELKDHVAALIKQFQSAVPVTDADLQAVSAKIDAINSALAGEVAKEDAALLPAPAVPGGVTAGSGAATTAST